jgi:hypothetical protein
MPRIATGDYALAMISRWGAAQIVVIAAPWRALHQRLRYTRRLCENRLRVLPTMEINPILNSIKDLSERSETIRGYL